MKPPMHGAFTRAAPEVANGDDDAAYFIMPLCITDDFGMKSSSANVARIVKHLMIINGADYRMVNMLI